MTIPNTTYRVLVEKLGSQDPSQFVGNEGEVFYDPNNPALKLSDGTTAGGVSIGGTGGGGSGESYWVETGAGIHTTSNVGAGTTNPRFALEVGAVGSAGTSLWVNGSARITGILTVGTSSIVLDGDTNTITVPNLVVTGVTTGVTADPGPLTINEIANNSYTLQLTDAENAVFGFGAPITVPNDSDIDFPVGTRITIITADVSNTLLSDGTESGAVVILAGTNIPQSLFELPIFSLSTLIKVAPNGWLLTVQPDGANTGNITFSEERIIGAVNTDFPLGVIQLTPSIDLEGAPFVTNGQYIDIYPTVADDAPHIHITAGTLSTESTYAENPNYYRGDLFIGDDLNYLSVRGNGEIRIQSDQYSGEINFTTGTYDRNVLDLTCGDNEIHIQGEGVDFDRDYALGRGETGYVGAGSSDIIYTSGVYEDETGSVKLLVQCQGSNGNCQLSELLIVRPFEGSTVFMNETGRVTGIGTSAHITFVADWNSDTSRIRVYADTSSDPNNDQWSFRIMPIEIQGYQD
jgi:hypothetical protein